MPASRLFTLTTCYGNHLYNNEAFSAYTYLLDKFAYTSADSINNITLAADNLASNTTKMAFIEYLPC
jgi:hypothetical protein